ERIEEAPNVEREERRPGLTIYRDRVAGLLVFRYAAPALVREGGELRPTGLGDVETIKLANPAPWRTLERLAADLADPMVDPPAKLRLYGNIRSQGAGRWISDEAWDACLGDAEIPDGGEIVIAADGAKTRDCTAVTWGWLNDDEVAVLRSRVWATSLAKPHHVLCPGRLDNNLARDFIRGELLPRYAVRMLVYDPRYFDDQAEDLSSEDGLAVVPFEPSERPARDAWDDFYAAIFEGERPSVMHDGDRVFRQHVRNAVGTKTERGWVVRKSKADGSKPIDALASAVLCRAGLKLPIPTREPMAAWA
ncbi:MAG: hypothetical protein L0206_23965, partial [Actinobacteria bacterium]|nr:hypothetical protein [Actinomycetota bacterium]